MNRPVGPTILVAEDDEAMLELVARWLEAAGYTVVKARNGVEVLEVVREAAPAAIVMDLTMPRMDGFQVLAKFRVLGLALAPVLLLTGRHSVEDVKKAVSLGAKDYLAKPVDRVHLLTRLERMLRAAAVTPPPAAAPGAAAPDKDPDEPGHYVD